LSSKPLNRYSLFMKEFNKTSTAVSELLSYGLWGKFF